MIVVDIVGGYEASCRIARHEKWQLFWTQSNARCTVMCTLHRASSFTLCTFVCTLNSASSYALRTLYHALIAQVPVPHEIYPASSYALGTPGTASLFNYKKTISYSSPACRPRLFISLFKWVTTNQKTHRFSSRLTLSMARHPQEGGAERRGKWQRNHRLCLRQAAGQCSSFKTNLSVNRPPCSQLNISWIYAKHDNRCRAVPSMSKDGAMGGCVCAICVVLWHSLWFVPMLDTPVHSPYSLCVWRVASDL